MAHYHFTVKPVSRRGGRSTVAKLAYRSATDLKDLRSGETHAFSSRGDVFHVDMLLPDDAPQWMVDLALELQTNRQAALQKLSNTIEAAEKRCDARLYREAEFALPNELTNDQNIEWSKEFIRDYFTSKGMMAIVNYHGEIDKKTGIYKPHCHVLLSTRNLAEDGFSSHKNRNWDSKELVEEWREQFANYQNAALKEHGFDARVTHLSYEDRNLDMEAESKLGKNVREMTARGIATDKQKIFDAVRLKNQFKVVKNPEVVFKIVTSMHSTFTRKDIAKVLNRYIDNAQQFKVLLDRLMTSKELVNLESSGVHKDTQEPVYTTQEMLRLEMNLVRQAEVLSAQKTHEVNPHIIEKVIAKYHEKFKDHGGLSPDQEVAIRHMLSGTQISCVVGFAGAGKTTCLEAVKEAWEEAGYKIIGLAPTGKAARNIESCGIQAMTIHKFLLAQKSGRERISDKTVLVGDEFGMVDSRRCSELLSLINQTGAKIVPMGDSNQAQSVEAGPAFRLLIERVKPAVLEKIVRQQIEWQREATRLFGILQTRDALKAYQEHGCFTTIQEKMPDLKSKNSLLDTFCLARQMSGRVWKEMVEDYKQEHLDKGRAFDPKTDFEILEKHQDFKVFEYWKNTRASLVSLMTDHYDNLQGKLKERGVNVKVLGSLVTEYKTNPTLNSAPNPTLFKQIERVLRQASYEHLYDTRVTTRQEMVKAWAGDYQTSSGQSHLMLAFTNKDANKLNELARKSMRAQGKIQGQDYQFVTQHIEMDDFGVEQRTYHNRTFAQGDRILFTRNNNGLNVKNGSLGTILSLDSTKMTVQLDPIGDKEPETLSFSPNLYPFIDNGWATTIIKAQGVTVDHVKLLASFEQYRNLAYVGMSRHRLTLKIYASSLDFWREEKIIDRLSRVQEKLSGFDYLDADKVQEKLAEDTEILWHQQKIQQGKDFLRAVKVTAWDVFHKLLDRPQGDKGKGEEAFLSFEDSEEMRSRDFFGDFSKDQRKGVFTREEADKEELSPERPKREVIEIAGTDQSLALTPADSQQGKGSQKERGKESLSSESISKPKSLPDSQENQDKKPGLSFLDRDIFDKQLKTIQDKIIQNKLAKEKEYATKTTLREKYPSFEEIDQRLKERINELAKKVLGNPSSQTSHQLRFGKKGSVCVFTSGSKQGLYANHEAGVYGGPLKLIEDQMKLDSPKEALKWASDWLGGHSLTVERQVIEKTQEKKATWTPITPVPKTVENPDIEGNKYLNYFLKDGYKETARYAYQDEQGNLKGYVFRFEKEEPDGTKSKKTPPLAYCVNDRGFKAWKWQAFETENKTPYGIEKLAQSPQKPVLIVSGEKTVGVATKLLPEYHVLTWSGGDGNVGKTNWASLTGKNVIIWPDHDESCQKAAVNLKEIITQLNADHGKEGSVSIVNLPETLPAKWDLADDLPQGWTLDTVRQMIQEAAPFHGKEADRQNINLSDSAFNTAKEESIPYASTSYPSTRLDPFAEKREQFEKERLPFHQEWCTTFGFFEQHKRFPEDEAEISAAYWQGERLTAIEGRLYGEALKKGEREIDEEKLTLQARDELIKNQSVPDHIRIFGKASELMKAQLKQFEQHVLLHRDKTNQLPNSLDLNVLCQAIKAHNQVMSIRDFKDKTGEQDSTLAHPQDVPENMFQQISSPSTPDASNAPDIYRTLIEQQAILTRTTNDRLNTAKGRSISYASVRLDPFAEEREQFEKERLPFHQEWSTTFGFFQQHKRFPENETEMSASYWQGERLTAIEGRLYGEALKKGEREIDEEELTLQARAELIKNQSVPDHIRAFRQASDLREAQLKQFEQHVLLHRDKTNELPNSLDLHAICQTIKAHNQAMDMRDFKDKTRGQNPTPAQLQDTLENVPKQIPPTSNPDISSNPGIYRTLIEQQAVLSRILNNQKEQDREKTFLKEGVSSQQLKPHEIQNFCSERLQRMDKKIQETKAFTQEMKILELNRQNQRGMEI